MKNGFLLHHLGLGDHIICNGLVRELSDRYDILMFPVKNHNLENIKFMLSDVQNINFISVKNDNEMLAEWQKYKSFFTPIRLGCFDSGNFIRVGETFCQSFYRQANVPYEKRWEKFHVPHNEDAENALEASIDEKTVFVHDDLSRDYKIKDKYLSGVIYRPSHQLGLEIKTTIFDYRKLLKKAEELHCMDSAFAAMIDHMPELLEKPKYIHRYVRQASQNPTYKNGWNLLYE
jgi:hypothetical protein